MKKQRVCILFTCTILATNCVLRWKVCSSNTLFGSTGE